VLAYDMGYPHSSYEDLINALIHWQGRGFPASKIMLGMPFYGRKSDWSYYAYNTIISLYNPNPDIDEIDGIFYNGVNTIKRKTQFVINNSYAGVTIWEICEDSVSPSSLLTAVSDSIHANSSMDINCSGKVDILDFARLAENYLNSTCLNANAWCDNCDKNLSGQIDYYDLAIFAEQWLCN
jgi:hypothetical protein